MTNLRASFRSAAAALGAILALGLTACPNGDVGAPCNHGDVEPPESKIVTFPALACNDLLCVYGEEKAPPQNVTNCQSSLDCNPGGGSVFECVSLGDDAGTECRLSLSYVLERSMCSKRCNSDADCKNTGITAAKKPVAESTKCKQGFSCVRIQQLGEFCCEKLCVCNDDLPDTTDLDMKCTDPNFCDDK